MAVRMTVHSPLWYGATTSASVIRSAYGRRFAKLFAAWAIASRPSCIVLTRRRRDESVLRWARARHDPNIYYRVHTMSLEQRGRRDRMPHEVLFHRDRDDARHIAGHSHIVA